MINDKHFVLLAGNPQKWDHELKQRCSRGNPMAEDLASVQAELHDRGYRGATLTQSAKGWYVRASSSLTVPSVLAKCLAHGGELDGSIEAAIDWGKKWANDDPENREFIAYKSDLAFTPYHYLNRGDL
jgi:hypothetical protein